MARLGCCICGGEMRNTVTPSENRLNVFYREEGLDAIRDNEDIALWDFYTGWDEKNACDNSFQKRSEPVEYWFCSECKSVHEVQRVASGRIIRSYKYIKSFNEDILIVDGLKELLVLKDIEMDELLSEDRILLRDYITIEKDIRYFINAAETKGYIVKDNKNIVGEYFKE
ncbi:MAG: hypothetical protein K6G26_04385 [Lachnospiraceae bacterium]|nr:hypothetical protein [Lachnospiraceae bacterium]